MCASILKKCPYLFELLTISAQLLPQAVKYVMINLTGENVSRITLTGENVSRITLTGENVSRITVTGENVSRITLTGENVSRITVMRIINKTTIIYAQTFLQELLDLACVVPQYI